MAEPLNGQSVKDLLETYFRVEDLREVLKAFKLPFIGRKQELLQRVLSLIDDKQYENDFIEEVNRKIVEIFGLRVRPTLSPLMAPNDHSKRGRKRKSDKDMKTTGSRYEDDDSYEASDSSEEENDSPLVISDTSVSDLEIQELPKYKKRKRVVESPETSNSSEDSDAIMDKYVNRSRYKRRKEEEKKRKKKTKDKEKKINKRRLVITDSSDSHSDNEITIRPKVNTEYISSDSDGDVIKKTKKDLIKKPIVLSSGSEAKSKSSTNDSDSNFNINKSIPEDDDDIQFLCAVAATQSTIVRSNQYRIKESTSSDTESSGDLSSGEDMDTNESQPSSAAPIEQLVTNALTENAISCDITVDKTNDTLNAINNSLSAQSIERNVSFSQIFSNNTNSVNIRPKSVDNSSVSEVESKPVVSRPKPLEPLEAPESSTVGPPEPQLPTIYDINKYIRTPNKKTFAIYTQKQGKPILTPAPPQLPPYLQINVIPPNQTINEVKKRLDTSNEEIEAIDQSLKVSLICPISNKRVITPCRSLRCHHFDCFDINNFLEINFNKRIDDWKCPKCKQSAKIEILVIDSLIEYILKMTNDYDPTLENVIFDAKAVWVPDIKKPEKVVNRSNEHNVINIDNSVEDIIELDDDDEDEDQSAQPMHSMPNTSDLLKSVSKTIESAKSCEQNISKLIQNSNQIQSRELRPPATSATSAQQNKQKTIRINRDLVNANRVQQLRQHLQNSVNQIPNASYRPPAPVYFNRNTSSAHTSHVQTPAVHTLNVSQISNTRTSVPTATTTTTQPNRVPDKTLVQNSNNSGNLVFSFDSNGIVSKVMCKICNEDIVIRNGNMGPFLAHNESATHKARVAASNPTANSIQNITQSARRVITPNTSNTSRPTNTVPQNNTNQSYIRNPTFIYNSTQNRYPIVNNNYMSAQPQTYTDPQQQQYMPQYTYYHSSTAYTTPAPPAHQSAPAAPLPPPTGQVYYPPFAGYQPFTPQNPMNNNYYNY